MTYALVTNSTIQAVQGRPPTSARRLDSGNWVLGLRTAPAALQQACGWWEITDTPRPDDTATTTHDRTVELVAGVPTVVWTERDKTQAELDAEAKATREQQIRGSVADYLSATDTFLAITSPTQAQVLAQVRRNAQALQGIAKLLVRSDLL